MPWFPRFRRSGLFLCPKGKENKLMDYQQSLTRQEEREKEELEAEILDTEDLEDDTEDLEDLEESEGEE